MRRLMVVALVSLLSGCLPDLSSWQVARPDGGALPRDDADRPRPRDAGPLTGGPCASPHLLVATENLVGGAGQVRRYELPAAGGLRECGPLTARGALMQQPFAIAAVSDQFVLVAGRGGVQGLDPVTDTERFVIERSGQHPNDAVVLFDESRSDWIAAVAWSNLGSSSGLRGSLREVTAYTIEGAERWRWDSTALGLSSSTAIGPAPNDSRIFLALHPSNWAAAEVDPFNQILRTPPLVGPVPSAALDTVAAGTGGGLGMIAWTGRVDGEPRLFTLEAPYTDDLTQVTCGEQMCELTHAVVDPSRPRAVMALCGRPGVTERGIVRLDFAAMVCETLVRREDAPPGTRFSYLTFAAAR